MSDVRSESDVDFNLDAFDLLFVIALFAPLAQNEIVIYYVFFLFRLSMNKSDTFLCVCACLCERRGCARAYKENSSDRDAILLVDIGAGWKPFNFVDIQVWAAVCTVSLGNVGVEHMDTNIENAHKLKYTRNFRIRPHTHTHTQWMGKS